MTEKWEFLRDLQSDITKMMESISTPLLQKIDEQEQEIERLKAELNRVQSNAGSQTASQTTTFEQNTALSYMDDKTLNKLKRFLGEFDESHLIPPDWSEDDANHEYKYARKLAPLKARIESLKQVVRCNAEDHKY
ncbi:hypothetical protein V7075_27775, partial [Neobacillus drentensis]|uniref:hypothetical protein n=1 Tax=Neobacillus drentensis TaxID=220684 RepID=UPI002FFEC36A